MTTGYSGTPLARKLGIEEGHRVATIAAPAHLDELVRPLPPGVEIESDPSAPDSFDTDTAMRHDVVVLFAPNRATLDRELPAAHRLLAPRGGLWVAWLKGSSPHHEDLNREAVRERVLRARLVDNKVCAIDDDWSALRFVYRLQDRKG